MGEGIPAPGTAGIGVFYSKILFDQYSEVIFGKSHHLLLSAAAVLAAVLCCAHSIPRSLVN